MKLLLNMLSGAVLCGTGIFTLVVMVLEAVNNGQLLLYEIPGIYYWEFPLMGVAIILSISRLLWIALKK